MSSSADIAIYGGAAGGGKTWAILLEAARHSRVKGYTGVIFRRTTTQIRKPGSLWSESTKLYPELGGVPRESYLDWRFPAGSEIKLAGLQHPKDREDWKGSQLAFLGFDELTDFDQDTFFFLTSRTRTTCGVVPTVRATCNPDPTSWVAEFVAWWIGEDGFPIKERAGKLRWFVRRGDEILWADKRAELFAVYPDLGKHEPKSVTFIPASVHDNQALLETNPEYLGTLKSLPLVDRVRFLDGNWKLVATGDYFRPAWFAGKFLSAMPSDVVAWVRSWDLAGTKPRPGLTDPDWTVGLLLGRRPDQTWIVADVVRLRDTPEAVANTIATTASTDKTKFGHVLTYLEQEPGSMSKMAIAFLVKRLAGHAVAWAAPTGSKIQRAKPVSSQAEAGNLWILQGPWNSDFVRELCSFPKRGVHDDQVDALSGGFQNCLPTQGFRPTKRFSE